MRKVTQQEIAEFEKDFTHKVLSNPDYRYGQAFINYFSWVHDNMLNDGDLGHAQAIHVWNSSKIGRAHV